VIFAHQGGWDELLLVAVPIAFIVYLLFIADRRASRNRDALPDPDATPDGTSPPPDGAAPTEARDDEGARPLHPGGSEPGQPSA
jgi:hypothetical protein